MIKEKPTPTKSDEELLELLKKASFQRAELRLMRIGGPRRFRYDVFSFSERNRHDVTETINALSNPNIQLLKILLANPNGESFLKRLDTEGASSWRIWRVMRHVFLFADKLLKINNKINIALHNEELTWNLGILGDREALVTAYGIKTGHDVSVKPQWLNSSEFKGLSKAFFNYFEAISKKNETVWLERGKKFSTSMPRWPSLFKGNAILAKEEHYDGTEEPEIQDSEVCKICINILSNKSEENWQSLSEDLRQKQNSFHPGKVVRHLENIRGKGLILKRFNGPTVLKLAANLNSIISSKDDSAEKCAFILKMIYEDTLISLSEFQNLSEIVFPNIKRSTYPYANKLCTAIADIKRHFRSIPDSVWDEAILDADTLGKELEKASKVPFRDSHLKNRIWQDDLPTEKIAVNLLKNKNEEILSLIRDRIIDIDFETACYNVTPYDDPFHILFFEYSIFDSFISLKQKQSLFQKYESLFKINTNLCFWRTGLARSLREYCRRLWYRNVMPKTYEYRYSIENPDYFLRLSLECSSRSYGFLNLRRLLEELEAQAMDGQKNPNFYDILPFFENLQSKKVQITSDILEDGEVSQSEPSPDLNIDANKAFKVFISYSHHDDIHRKNIEKCLILLKRAGLIDIWHDRRINAGEEWGKAIKNELSQANIILFLVSYDFLSSDYITDIEVKQALAQHKTGQSLVVPIIVRDVSIKYTEFGHLQALPEDGKPIATWEHIDSAWKSVEEGLRNLISNIKKDSRQSRNG
jgi:hypothetical protein